MSTAETIDALRGRLLANYTLLFLRSFEEERWERELSSLALEIERGLVVWTTTDGPLPPPGNGDEGYTDPAMFLDQIADYPPDHLFLLKDFHPYLGDPHVLRKLRDLTLRLPADRKAILFLSPETEIPPELRKDAVAIELPLPGLEELKEEFEGILSARKSTGESELKCSADEEEKLLKAVLGLTAREARKALSRATIGREKIDDDVFRLLVSEKRRMVEGSDLLEFYDLNEGLGDVGGLEALKSWMRQRAEAFSTRAREQGIPTPKGVLLLGVQGCGKSLTARAAARLLSFPLVRLDASNLLSTDRGASERNMRDVLRLMETIAPAVLWVDEIEKGFAGSDGQASQDPTMQRLVGKFLTWMEEKPAPVFVVATANSVTGLPPEMLRRGRFDELFFIDLPNYHERIRILQIHLTKRGWKPEKYDLEELATRTEGFSGAEIEQVIIAAMIDAFGTGEMLSQEHLLKSRDKTVPLSVTMEEKIFQLREWCRTRCRPATPDSRVLQMIEEEGRRTDKAAAATIAAGGEVISSATREWMKLAEHGQFNAAVLEYIRHNDYTTFPGIQQAFAPYFETSGEIGLALKSDTNVILGLGMSQELAQILASLISNKRIFLHPADASRFDKSAAETELPLLRELPEDRIGRPSWFPTSLRDLAAEEPNPRLARVARMMLARPGGA